MSAAAFAADFFARVDSLDVDDLGERFTDDVRMQAANMPALQGVDAVVTAFTAGGAAFESMTHTIVGVWTGTWERGEVISVEAVVNYNLVDGRHVTLGATSTLRLIDGLVADYRIFYDPSPLAPPA